MTEDISVVQDNRYGSAVGKVPTTEEKRTTKRAPISDVLLPLYVFVGVGFVIYIPVAILNSVAPLLILDGLLILCLFMALVDIGKRKGRILGGSKLVFLLIIGYLTSAIIGIFVGLYSDIDLVTIVKGFRSLVFGIGFIFVSSLCMTSQQSVDRFIKVYIYGSLLAGLYGVWQRFFGLLPFELERLSKFGSLAGEIEYTGRFRIPSLFVDPATFSFFMMVAIILLPIIRRRPILPHILRKFYWLGLGLLFAGILFSLVRGPLVGLVGGLLFLIVIKNRNKFKIAFSLVVSLMAIVLLAAVLNYMVINRSLSHNNSEAIRAIDKVITNAWSVLPIPAESYSLPQEVYAIKTQSMSERRMGWLEGFKYMTAHPFGGGIGSSIITKYGEYRFSPIDVGFMRYGLEMGWLGFISMIALWLSIGFISYKKLKRIPDEVKANVGQRLLGVWIASAIATLSTAFLHTEIISGDLFIIGGILLNLDLIAKNSCE
jgi:hypothetical protein